MEIHHQKGREMPNIIEIVTRLFDREKSWSKLTSSEWVGLLVECPELADRCDRVNGWKSFSGSDWVELLEHQPRFAEQCGEWNGEEDFTVWDTIRLLREQPCLIDLCPLLKSDNAQTWVCLLESLPQLVKNCDLAKLDYDYKAKENVERFEKDKADYIHKNLDHYIFSHSANEELLSKVIAMYDSTL